MQPSASKYSFVVIADDLTGATEIGGIGLRYNLTVDVLNLPFSFRSEADLVIINADTRSKSKDEAEAIISQICNQIKEWNPSFIFKKIDSVLRGHVIAEIEVQAAAFGQQRALIIPTNPHLGRSIRDGIYYISNVPLNKTSFAEDPEFPAQDAHVKAMLNNDEKVVLCRPEESLPSNAWIVGEVASELDTMYWADQEDAATLLAGSAGFFNALMAKRFEDFSQHRHERVMLQYPLLYVCGSKFESSIALVEDLSTQGDYVSYMPEELLNMSPGAAVEGKLIQQWKEAIKAILADKGKAVIAVNNSLSGNKAASPRVIKEQMAQVIKAVLEEAEINELIIEGGATASEILKILNENHLQMVQELAQGLTRSIMANKQTHVTLKPGSYSWTSDIWKF